MSNQFCDESNIGSSIKCISEELNILGYPEILYEDNERQVLMNLINLTWTLIKKMEKLCIKENERTMDISKLKSQIASHSLEKSRLEKVIDKERNITLSVKESLNNALSVQKKLSKELYQSKVEINKLKKLHEVLNVQFGNEILRKENLILNLRDKLAHFVNSSAADVEEIPTLSQFSHITKNYPKLDKYITSLSNNIQILLLENANIRYLIFKIFVEIGKKCNIIIDEKELIHYLLNLSDKEFLDQIETKFGCILDCLKIK